MKNSGQMFQKFDEVCVDFMHRWGITFLRIALGVVFLWFGVLKIFDVTPVTDLISQTYYFLPTKEFVSFLGVWEVVIGLGLILKAFLRTTLVLLWLQMLGTFGTFLLMPSLFFNGNLFLLTIEGEFVVKNLVLIAASLVIGGYEVKRKKHNAK